MVVDTRFSAESLQRAKELSITLQRLGDKDLKNELRRALRTDTKPMRIRIRDRVRSALPQSGKPKPLSLWVGGMPLMDSRFQGERVSLKIKLARRDHDLVAMDSSGVVRHPVFGRRHVWTTTLIHPEWWEESAEPEAEEFVRVANTALERAMSRLVSRRGGA